MSSSSTPTRLSWIDTVKGLAIVLVVLHHAAVLAAAKNWSGDQLNTLTDALLTVRMPLFFAMSGFFFLRRVDRPWSWQLRNRAGPFLWLYVLWTVLWVLAFHVTPGSANPNTNWGMRHDSSSSPVSAPGTSTPWPSISSP